MQSNSSADFTHHSFFSFVDVIQDELKTRVQNHSTFAEQLVNCNNREYLHIISTLWVVGHGWLVIHTARDPRVWFGDCAPILASVGARNSSSDETDEFLVNTRRPWLLNTSNALNLSVLRGLNKWQRKLHKPNISSTLSEVNTLLEKVMDVSCTLCKGFTSKNTCACFTSFSCCSVNKLRITSWSRNRKGLNASVMLHCWYAIGRDKNCLILLKFFAITWYDSFFAAGPQRKLASWWKVYLQKLTRCCSHSTVLTPGTSNTPLSSMSYSVIFWASYSKLHYLS